MTPSESSPAAAAPVPSPVQQAALEAARERAIRLLTDRFADDTLTVDDFEARLDRMYLAQSPADLDAITADLVGQPTPAPGQRVAVPAAYAPRLPAIPSDVPPIRRVLALMSESRHGGRFAVPQRLDVVAVMGDLMLDLRDAVLTSGFCEIDVIAVMANVKVLVPPGVIVEGMVTSFMAAYGNDAEDDGRLSANAPRIRLTGIAVMAEVRVRTAPSGEPAKRAWRQARQR
jgi:hypothetical protein